MTTALIFDGYTLNGFLEPVGPWSGVRFRFRPALAEGTLEYLYQRDLVQGKAQLKPLVDFLSQHLVGWDIKDAKGDVTPVTPENLRRLPFAYLNQMLDHIMGYAKAEAADDVKNSAGG